MKCSERQKDRKKPPHRAPAVSVSEDYGNILGVGLDWNGYRRSPAEVVSWDGNDAIS
jgi:hypothetical protein